MVSARDSLTARIAVAFVLCFALFATVAAGRTTAAEPVAITDAPPLTWGLKESWRAYSGLPALSGGAIRQPDPGFATYTLGWTFVSGSYDPETRTTILRYRGTARWQKYPGYGDLPDDQFALDLTVSDPVVTISRERAVVTAALHDRGLGADKAYGPVDVVDLAVDAVTPTVAGATTTWTQIPAAFNDQATAPFGGAYYRPGMAFDPVSFSYTGPGGAPDFTDAFTAPATRRLALDGANHRILPPETANGMYELVTVDRLRRLAYYRVRTGEGGAQQRYHALDLDTGATLDGSFLTPYSGAGSLAAVRFVDSGTGRVYAGPNQTAEIGTWFRYVRGEGFQQGVLDAPPGAPWAALGALGWDPANRRAFQVVKTIPEGVPTTAYDRHLWQLRTYTAADEAGDTWTTKVYDLANADPLVHNRYLYLTGTRGVAARDGSLIVLGDQRATMTPATPAPARVPGAFRIVLTDTAATVTPIAGTDITNSNAARYSFAATGDDGTIALVQATSGAVQRLDAALTAEPVVDPAFPLSEIRAEGVAIDPEDGTVWLGGLKTQRIVGVREGRVVADQQFALRSTRDAGLIAGPDHTLWTQSTELDAHGNHLDTLIAHPVGLQRLARIGVSPTLGTEPANRTVALGVGESSVETTFVASATADPAPAVQWQVKAPGSPRFKDVAGATAATLAVRVERGMDGTQYRAVFENPAGRIATRAATLTAHYAPRVSFEPVDLTVEPGEAATFAVLSDANPEPELQWQRRVGGFWQPISPDDDNFTLHGPTLVVHDTNVDQSGALFRARLTNGAGRAYSRAAKLTVAPGVVIPPEGIDRTNVTLDWTGNAELQKAPPFGGSNFFSAGVSDGTEATYRAAAGSVRVLHAPETPASWLTRGSHITGGGQQLVRLHGGRARIEPDGAATVRWDGAAFSVNFYGGLVPFTVTNPKLVIAPDGSGTLSADLSGYASSIANPNQREPIAPVANVTLATFSGVQLDPEGAVTFTPAYAGVPVDVPAGTAPQNRTAAGWGAWPQAFVDFHVRTGLSSYWYSSGGSADPLKAPAPFVVDFDGAALPVEPEPTPQPQPSPTPAPPAPQPQPKPAPAQITPVKATQRLTRAQRTVRLATVACPRGTAACTLTVPKRVRVRIAGRAFQLTLLSSGKLAAGRSASVRLRLPNAAAVRLRGRKLTVRVPIAVTVNGRRTTRTAAVRLQGARR